MRCRSFGWLPFGEGLADRLGESLRGVANDLTPSWDVTDRLESQVVLFDKREWADICALRPTGVLGIDGVVTDVLEEPLYDSACPSLLRSLEEPEEPDLRIIRLKRFFNGIVMLRVLFSLQNRGARFDQSRERTQ